MNLGRIDGVTHVVTLAVRYVRDQALRLAKLLTDQLYDVDVLHLVVTTDIVNLTNAALVNDQVDGLTVILNI